MLARLNKGIAEVMGKPTVLKDLSPADFTNETFGLPTVRDILAELESQAVTRVRNSRRRPSAKAWSRYRLAAGMVLEGVVTNVAAFGAFVDIGVHQDGLVHVSALANKFVKDPHEVVKPGRLSK